MKVTHPHRREQVEQGDVGQRRSADQLSGAALAAVLLALHLVLTSILTGLFPPHPPAGEILRLLAGISRRPRILALWFGPVVCIGIAGFEELSRVLVLRRLWHVLPGRAGSWAVIIGSAVLVAGVHHYQPPAIMLSIALLSVLKGWWFMKTLLLSVICHQI